MHLDLFVRSYCDSRPLSAHYAATLAKRTAKLAAFAGRSKLAEVFNEATLNAFLATLEALSPYTQNKYRQDFLAVWRAAADDDLIGYPQPRRIRRVKIVPQRIECYDEGQARSLATAAEHLRGAYPNGVARRHYWPAIIRAAWDSGLRRGDLWRLKLAEIRKDGSAVIIQAKTRRAIVCRFHSSTVRALAAAGGSLAWPLCEWCFGFHFREIVEASGLRRGTFRWLRRGSGSVLDAAHPGLGHEQLGNTRAVFEKHYDAKLNGHKRPMLPEL